VFPYIAWDPGNTIGVAAFNSYGDCVAKSQLKVGGLDLYFEQLQKFIVDNPERRPEVFIIEDYRVFQHKAKIHIGSRLETARISGAIEAFARRNIIEIVFQPANILGITQMWSGIRMPSNHAESHKIAAFLHGYHYLYKKGIIQPRVLEDP